MMYLGSDHAGWQLKQEVKGILQELGQAFEDLGNLEPVMDDDYPDYAFAVGEAVAPQPGNLGILLCGSAEGMCLAANKVKGVRAVYVTNADEAVLTREHNDANVLCLSGWHESADVVRPIIEAFIKTPFTNDARHVRRIAKITAYEHGS